MPSFDVVPSDVEGFMEELREFQFEEYSEPFEGALMPVVTRPATCIGGSSGCPMPRQLAGA